MFDVSAKETNHLIQYLIHQCLYFMDLIYHRPHDSKIRYERKNICCEKLIETNKL